MMGNLIVFENRESPASILPRLRHTHFRGTVGVNRAGFIPPSSGDGHGVEYDTGAIP
jgi:hypothetical protein